MVRHHDESGGQRETDDGSGPVAEGGVREVEEVHGG
jgi:hypothetical protein